MKTGANKVGQAFKIISVLVVTEKLTPRYPPLVKRSFIDLE